MIRGAWLENVDIDGEVRGLTVNGVDVGPFVEAELDRRDPRRVKMRPTTAAGFREAWPVAEEIWAQSVQRARRLPPHLLHERVEDEWSYIETLRHLVFCTDAWVVRAVLGEERPYSRLGLLHTEAEPDPLLPNDPDARPSLEEILTVRAARMTSVAEVIAGLTTSNWPATSRSTPPATLRRGLIRYSAASEPLSTRSGPIGHSPSVTWTCWKDASDTHKRRRMDRAVAGVTA